MLLYNAVLVIFGFMKLVGTFPANVELHHLGRMLSLRHPFHNLGLSGADRTRYDIRHDLKSILTVANLDQALAEIICHMNTIDLQEIGITPPRSVRLDLFRVLYPATALSYYRHLNSEPPTLPIHPLFRDDEKEILASYIKRSATWNDLMRAREMLLGQRTRDAQFLANLFWGFSSAALDLPMTATQPLQVLTRGEAAVRQILTTYLYPDDESLYQVYNPVERKDCKITSDTVVLSPLNIDHVYSGAYGPCRAGIRQAAEVLRNKVDHDHLQTLSPDASSLPPEIEAALSNCARQWESAYAKEATLRRLWQVAKLISTLPGKLGHYGSKLEDYLFRSNLGGLMQAEFPAKQIIANAISLGQQAQSLVDHLTKIQTEADLPSTN